MESRDKQDFLEIEFVESLPKTISGKIHRVELREMERQKKLEK